MSVGACFIVEVAIGRRSEGVCWLVLQHDAESTKGWYLFQHADLQEPAKFDSWHPNSKPYGSTAYRRMTGERPTPILMAEAAGVATQLASSTPWKTGLAAGGSSAFSRSIGGRGGPFFPRWNPVPWSPRL
jgi:hypothetical protein